MLKLMRFCIKLDGRKVKFVIELETLQIKCINPEA